MLKLSIFGIIFIAVSSSAEVTSIGVVGDSSITGAAANPRLDANIWTFGKEALKVFMSRALRIKSPGHSWPNIEDYSDPKEFGITAPIEGPARIFFGASEITPQKTVRSHSLDAQGSYKVDTEEYSFAYMVGRGLGVPAKNIYFVAQDGKRVGVIETQMRRFFEVPEIAARGTLPELIFVLFTANNLCHEENLKRTVSQAVGYYKDSLEEQFEKVFSKFKPNRKGTHIVLLAPFNVAQIFDNFDVLNSPVRLQNKIVRCKEFRRPYSLKQSFVSRKIIEGLENMCPSVLKTDLRDSRRIEHIKGIITGFADVQSQIVQEWQDRLPPGFSFDYFRETFDMRFAPGDTTNDCFHPGIRAHEKIARKMLEKL